MFLELLFKEKNSLINLKSIDKVSTLNRGFLTVPLEHDYSLIYTLHKLDLSRHWMKEEEPIEHFQ
jgi:hypothetical protein